MFSRKDNHDIHVKIVHHGGRVGLPVTVPQAGPSNIIPQAGLSNAGPSDKDIWGSDFENNDDDKLLAALDMDFEMEKGRKLKKDDTAARVKKARLALVKTPGFIEIDSSFNRKIVWYYAKNLTNIQNYRQFFLSIKPALIDLLKSLVRNNSIKFNLKL
ncbi:Hypothetical protein CINCED_3A023123 [Cinara cedri]|nr:Hypothetical protein CINCED_3A023123 [Cinara cedri]